MSIVTKSTARPSTVGVPPPRNGDLGEDEKPKRLTLVLPGPSWRRLKNLQQETGAPTMIELISRALRVMEYIVNAKRSNSQILVREKHGEPKVIEFVW